MEYQRKPSREADLYYPLGSNKAQQPFLVLEQGQRKPAKTVLRLNLIRSRLTEHNTQDVQVSTENLLVILKPRKISTE